MELDLKLAPWVAAAFISWVFLDSLRFKFTGHKTPTYFFKKLRGWSHISLFYPAGPWIIGAGEAVSSILLLLAPLVLMFQGNEGLLHLSQLSGAVLALVIMTGAVFFHLFSPLGVKTPTKWEGDMPVKWSPALFIAAIGCWLCAAFLILPQWAGALMLSLAGEGCLIASCRLELQRHAVHAVAKARRLRPVVEHVTEVSAAATAMHFRPRHSHRGVALLADGIANRPVEARPAGA